MTKFCIVAPPQILNSLYAHGFLGHYHLLLAHDVVAQEKEYEGLFRYRSWPKDDELVILDNSVIETGNAVDLEMMAEAIDICKPTVVVLPDILLDGEATAISCANALDKWPRVLPSTTEYCYIPQGKSITEFIASARALEAAANITFWGCARNLVDAVGSRAGPLKILKQTNAFRRIHMMGFSDRMSDDVDCAQIFEPYSIDSAVPLRINHPLLIDSKPKARGTWWKDGKLTQFTVQNLAVAQKWFA